MPRPILGNASLHSLMTGVMALGVAGFTTFATSTFVPDNFLPANVDVIRPASGLIAVVAILGVWSVQTSVRRLWIYVACIMATVTLLAVVLLNQRFAVTVALGPGSAETKLLTGYRYTRFGEAALVECGDVSREDLVECSGPDTIPAIWGASYWTVAGLYVLSYFVFVFTAVAGLGAGVLGLFDSSGPDAAHSAPGP